MISEATELLYFFRFGLLRTEGKSSIREIGICVRKKFLICLPTVGEGTQCRHNLFKLSYFR